MCSVWFVKGAVHYLRIHPASFYTHALVFRRSILPIVGCVLALSALFPVAASAQKELDISRLERYYTESNRSEKNREYYEPIIATERGRIRDIIQANINAVVQPSEGEGALESAKAIDRQREVVRELEERLNERTVDLNLLKEEEKIYLAGNENGTGVFMMTKSYPELLARKVVLEEGVELYASALAAQQTRLQQFLLEERTKNVGLFLLMLWYFVIVFAVITLESFIRTQVILRLPSRKFRYALSKVFTLIVYLSLIFWLGQQILAEYPGFTTVFAVIGAALIFMLQDVIKSLMGWFTYRGSLKLGDRVTLGGYTGDVLDISMLYTTLLVARSPTLEDPTLAGKSVRVPNVQLLTGTLVNFHSTSDFENVEIPLYLADVQQGERAKKVLGELLAEEASAYAEEARRQMDRRMRGSYFSQVSPSIRVYMEMTEKRELKFNLCFPAPIGQRRQITTKILQGILERFEKEGILLAKPA